MDQNISSYIIEEMASLHLHDNAVILSSGDQVSDYISSSRLRPDQMTIWKKDVPN